MTDDTAFAALSDSLEATVQAGAPLVAGLEWADCGRLSGVLWQAGVIVTSEQSLPGAENYTAILPGGGRVAATLAGRDPATNVAALRIEGAAATVAPAEPRGVGGLAVALGSDFSGGTTARLGAIEMLGPAWQSQRGGQIDRLVRVGVRLGAAAEGGPVLNASGGVLGMSTFGPHRGVPGDSLGHHRPRAGPVAPAGAHRAGLAGRGAASGGAAGGGWRPAPAAPAG